MEVQEIRVDGSHRDGYVELSFANVALKLNPETARNLAFALMEQADRAEREMAS